MIEKKLEDSGCGTPVDSGIHFFLIFLLSLLSRLWTVNLWKTTNIIQDVGSPPKVYFIILLTLEYIGKVKINIQ